MATVRAADAGRDATKREEPARPTSSPANNAKTTARCDATPARAARTRSAASSTATVPDALSSAPLWMARSFGRIDPIPP